MNERANYLKTLIRYSTQAKLTMPTQWFMDIPCSDKMYEQKKEIKEAIEYLKKDGRTDIQIKEGEEYYTIKLEAVDWLNG